jgi:hypothetical protein
MSDDVWVRRNDASEVSINLTSWVRYPLNWEEERNGWMIPVFIEAALLHDLQSDRWVFEFEPKYVPLGAEVDYGFGKIKLRHRRDYRPKLGLDIQSISNARPWGLNYVELTRAAARRLARKAGVTIPHASSPLSPPRQELEVSLPTPESRSAEQGSENKKPKSLSPTAELLLAGLEALGSGWHTAEEIASRAKLRTSKPRVREILGWLSRLEYVESGGKGYKRTPMSYPFPLPPV